MRDEEHQTWLPSEKLLAGRLTKAPAVLVRSFVHFLKIEAASGVILLICTAIALVLSNSPWAHAVEEFWEIPVGFRWDDYQLTESLRHWVNDALMAIFFFVVGLEIKRELVAGELRDPKKAALPAMAALGGMIVPAGLYLAFQWGEPGERGWGIPMDRHRLRRRIPGIAWPPGP
jgi:Na+:H+ antiporter, NhaA family